jgi:hypothetical protein
MPAITSMPASGFFTSCAIAAAISPQRRQAIAQALALFELLDASQVLEEERRADVAPARVLDVRQRVADHLLGVLEPHLARLGRCERSNALPMIRQHVGDVLRTSADRTPMSVVRASGPASGRRSRSSPPRVRPA